MTLFSIIAALVLEQFQPANVHRFVLAPMRAWGRFLEARFNDGSERAGLIAWAIGVGLPTLAAGIAYYALVDMHPGFGFLLNVLILYFVMGFRHFSHRYGEIQRALRAGELDAARRELADWRGRTEEHASSVEVARLAIEEALLRSHRSVFALILWFVLLPGPVGAVLYRASEFFGVEWGGRAGPEFGLFGRFAARALGWLEWLPARATAAGFAVVGDFEDALFCWRTQAGRWPDPASGILLASGAGAIGVRLGLPVYESGEISERPELGLGDDPDADYMQSAIGLVWRTLALWLFLIALVSAAAWVGH